MKDPVRRELAVIREAIDAVVPEITMLQASSAMNDLVARVAACKRRAESWATCDPSPQERKQLMLDVLAIHLEVARLHRQPGEGTPPGIA